MSVLFFFCNPCMEKSVMSVLFFFCNPRKSRKSVTCLFHMRVTQKKTDMGYTFFMRGLHPPPTKKGHGLCFLFRYAGCTKKKCMRFT